MFTFSKADTIHSDDDIMVTITAPGWDYTFDTPFTTTLEIFFVNYDDTVTRASTTITSTVTLYCAGE